GRRSDQRDLDHERHAEFHRQGDLPGDEHGAHARPGLREGPRAVEGGQREEVTDLILRSRRRRRLEGWPHTQSLPPWFETAAARAPPHEGCCYSAASGSVTCASIAANAFARLSPSGSTSAAVRADAIASMPACTPMRPSSTAEITRASIV